MTDAPPPPPPPALVAALAERYRFERLLGAGGMATVYLAHDLRHDRRVAIKVLRPGVAEVIGERRFLQEIRVTANLQHPHILPLHDSGSAGDLLYYVMPWVNGESLRDRMTAQPRLPVDDVLRIGAQVSGALEYAHRHGVIHRDVKPENILLQDDQACVADFGIAFAVNSDEADRLTRTGVSLGTPQYMSPEYVMGERALDARSDVYSLGITLYEALTGETPFTGPTAHAIIARVLTEEPPPPSHVRGDLSVDVDAAVMTAIDKDPARRFQTAAAMQEALLGRATLPTQVIARRPRRRRWTRPVALAAGLAAMAGVYLASRQFAHGAPHVERAIVALPLENFGTEPAATAYLADGIPEEIVGSLAGTPNLVVRPMPRDPRYRGRTDLAAVARELHADLVLTGSLLVQGDSIRITVRPYDVAGDAFLRSVSFTDSRGSVFGLEDSIARVLAAQLDIRGAGPARFAALQTTRRPNPAAHDSLLLARWYEEKRDCASLDRAVGLLTSATRLDTAYAQAWATLAQTHNLRAAFFCARSIDEFVPARAAVARALALDTALADVHVTLGFMHVIADWDAGRAATEFARAVQLDSTRATTFLFRTWSYVLAGRLDSARMSVRHAESLDPSSSIIRTRVGTLLVYSDSLEQAAAELRAVLDREPGYQPAESDLAVAYAKLHRCPEAMALLRPARVGVVGAGDLTFVQARCGAAGPARATVLDWEARAARGEYVAPFQVAVAYAGLGDEPKVFEWLNRALAERDWQLCMLAPYPAFEAYRARPAFKELLRKIGAPVTG